MLSEKIDRKRERTVRFGLAVGLAPVPRKGVVRTRVLVDRDERVRRESALEQLVDLRLHPAVLHRHVQHERPVQVLGFADAVLDVGAVVGDGTVDVGTAAHQVTELAAEAVADRADLAVALRTLLQIVPSVLHVAHREVVVEVVVEIERLLDVLRIAVGELDTRLLAPEEIGHEADESRLGELVRVMAHGVVDAPNLHDGDDRARRRLVGDGEIGPHLAVAELDLDVLRFHSEVTSSSAFARCRRKSAPAPSPAYPASSRPRWYWR